MKIYRQRIRTLVTIVMALALLGVSGLTFASPPDAGIENVAAAEVPTSSEVSAMGSESSEESDLENRGPHPDIGKAPPWVTLDALDDARDLAERGKGVFFDERGDRLEDGAVTHLFVIQPGSMLIHAPGILGAVNFCTGAYLFSEGFPRTFYISTAGHCTSVGDDVFGLANVGSTSVLFHLGETAFQEHTVAADWALVEIFSVWYGNLEPSTVAVGGPDCVTTISPSLTATMKAYGHGVGTSVPGIGSPRTGLGGSGGVDYHMMTSGGDSGMPVMWFDANLQLANSLAGCATYIHNGSLIGVPGLGVGTHVSHVLSQLPSGFSVVTA